MTQIKGAAFNTPGRCGWPGRGFTITRRGWPPAPAKAGDPYMGRFLQTDPIGYGDGLNMYSYVGGDPVNARDPSGLSRVCKITYTQTGDGPLTPQWTCWSTGGLPLPVPPSVAQLFRGIRAFGGELRRQIEDAHALNCAALNQLPIPPGSEVEGFIGNRFAGKVTVGRAQDGNIYYGAGLGAGYGASVGISEIFTGRQTAGDFAGLSVSIDYDNPVAFARAMNNGERLFASGIALGLDINLLPGKSFTAKDFGGELGAQYGRGFGVTINATAACSSQ